mgnify:CR=1 FL=1
MGTTTDSRDVLAFMDLGETESGAYRNTDANFPGLQLFPGPNPAQKDLPSNKNNNLDPATLSGQYSGIRDISQANSILQSEQLDESVEYVELANAWLWELANVKNVLGLILFKQTLEVNKFFGV